MIRKKVFIDSNGCARRRLDCSRLGEYFKVNNCKLAGNYRKADYIIFVTCSFNQAQEDMCWKRIERYQRCRGKLIVAGCLPEIVPAKFNQKFKGEYISTKNLDEIDRLFDNFKFKFKDTSDAHQFLRACYQMPFLNSMLAKLAVVKNNIKQAGNFLTMSEYGYLRICYGCIEKCAYCSIRNAIGKLKSKPIYDCIKEYKGILQNGYHKIIILADNVGAYGLDIKSSFAELMDSLSAVSNRKVHWYIQDLHPKWLLLYKSKLLEMAKDKKIMEILCPIQSGSNRILKLMNRHSDIKEIKEVLLALKKSNPGLKLYTHIIVGFPSETEKDFQETLNAISEIRFDRVYLFTYYDGYGTIASEMDGKVDKLTIDRRMKDAADFLEPLGIPVICDN